MKKKLIIYATHWNEFFQYIMLKRIFFILETVQLEINFSFITGSEVHWNWIFWLEIWCIVTHSIPLIVELLLYDACGKGVKRAELWLSAVRNCGACVFLSTNILSLWHTLYKNLFSFSFVIIIYSFGINGNKIATPCISNVQLILIFQPNQTKCMKFRPTSA